jgi:hypothetical protein
VVTLATLLYAIPSNSKDDIEDLVDIEQVGGKIFAIRDGIQTTPFELKSKEEVLWLDSDGYIGALLTNERFIAISLSSSGWLEKPLKSKEAYDGSPILSPTLALLVTKERVIGFDAIAHRFIEQSLRLTVLSNKVLDWMRSLSRPKRMIMLLLSSLPDVLSV